MIRDRRLVFAALLALAARAVFIPLHRIDSDEPQHLHVAWAWSQGLVQYREVFDNHFPLLHLLFAPLMAVVPESSSVFFWMRLAIAPIAIGCAVLVFILGRRMIGDRGAAVAAIAFSLMPPWLPKSVEFRNDTLWIFLWLAAIALLIPGRRPLLAGVAAALCLLASVKALPLLLAHVLAIVSQRQPLLTRDAWRMAGGAAIPLAAVTILFSILGALDEMLYATLLFNASLPVDPIRRAGGALAFAVLAPALALCARRGAGARPVLPGHLLLVAVWYPLVMVCLWPSVSPRDFLPLVPLASLALGSSPVLAAAPMAVAIGGVIVGCWYARIWRPADSARHGFVDAAVALTSPNDYVFDLKGNAVFRRRPVYFIYDIVGRALTKRGDLPDDAPERIVARRCCVAIDDAGHLPQRTRRFLQRHFIDIGPLRVCGAIAGNGEITIAVPETYAVVARDPAAVSIDGVPYRGPRFLTAGRHTIRSREARVAVIWARAAGGGPGPLRPELRVADRSARPPARKESPAVRLLRTEFLGRAPTVR